MFLPSLPRKARGPPLLAWMLLTTRGKKYKPFKPEKTAEQVRGCTCLAHNCMRFPQSMRAQHAVDLSVNQCQASVCKFRRRRS